MTGANEMAELESALHCLRLEAPESVCLDIERKIRQAIGAEVSAAERRERAETLPLVALLEEVHENFGVRIGRLELIGAELERWNGRAPDVGAPSGHHVAAVALRLHAEAASERAAVVRHIRATADVQSLRAVDTSGVVRGMLEGLAAEIEEGRHAR